jgi:hypothetical protein
MDGARKTRAGSRNEKAKREGLIRDAMGIARIPVGLIDPGAMGRIGDIHLRGAPQQSSIYRASQNTVRFPGEHHVIHPNFHKSGLRFPLVTMRCQDLLAHRTWRIS